MRQTIGAPAMTPARNHQRVIVAARRPRPAAAYPAAPAAPGTFRPSAANTVAKTADRPSSATQAMIEAVSLSPSACLRRVKALEASGIIEGYRAEISRTKAGLGLTAFIGLRVDGHSRATSDQVERALMAIPAVVACYVVTGSDDFMVEVAAQDLADYEKVLLDEILAIPAVLTAHSAFAIRTVLSRGPVPLNHWR